MKFVLSVITLLKDITAITLLVLLTQIALLKHVLRDYVHHAVLLKHLFAMELLVPLILNVFQILV